MRQSKDKASPTTSTPRRKPPSSEPQPQNQPRPEDEKGPRKRVDPPIERGERDVDEAGEQSFPASDPPAWTLGVDVRRPGSESGLPFDG